VRAPLWVEGDGTRVGGRRPLMRRWAAQIDLRAISIRGQGIGSGQAGGGAQVIFGLPFAGGLW
jgi:hypothetical protein